MPRCSSPTILTIPIEQSSKPSFYRSSADSLSNIYRVVPCGKCVNCLKNKQSDFAFRIVQEARKYGSMVFVTFTYRPKTVPFSVSIERLDKDTGEVFRVTRSCILEDSDLLSICRQKYDYTIKKREPFYYYYNLMEDESSIIRSVCSPSISRLDFRLWLKRERVRYKRQFGKGLPPFSYCCIGEYGEHTLRPHMHCCFMGLSYTEVCRLCESWKKDFGFVYVEKVNCVNSDGSSGFSKAARYVAKYLFKGKFDNPAVLDRIVEKGRICCSKSLGVELTPALKDYLLCKDIFGEIDFKNVSKISGSKFTQDELKLFATQFANRSIVNVDGTYFRLPRSIIRRLFYDTIKTYSLDGKVSKVEYKANNFRLSCSALIQDNFLRNYFSECESCYRQFLERRDFNSLRAAIVFKKSCESFEEKSREVGFRRSLSKSIF